MSLIINQLNINSYTNNSTDIQSQIYFLLLISSVSS